MYFFQFLGGLPPPGIFWWRVLSYSLFMTSGVSDVICSFLFTLAFFFFFFGNTGVLEFLLSRWNSELFLHNSSVLLSNFQFFITHDKSPCSSSHYSAHVFVFLFIPSFPAPMPMAWYLPSYPSFGMFPYIMKMTYLLWETRCSYVSLIKVIFF